MDTWLIGLTNSLLVFLHKLCVDFLKLSVITPFFNMRVFNIFIYYSIFTSKFFVVSEY